MKLTPKQKEIIKLMRHGYSLMTGLSETTGTQYYLIASTHNNGYGDTYFRADVFTNLLHKKLIYFDNRNFEYLLTELGETIKL